MSIAVTIYSRNESLALTTHEAGELSMILDFYDKPGILDDDHVLKNRIGPIVRMLARAAEEGLSMNPEAGGRLQKVRRALGLRREDLAEMAGETPGMIAGLEAGGGWPSGAVLVALHEQHGISGDWLLFGDEDGRSRMPPELLARIEREPS